MDIHNRSNSTKLCIKLFDSLRVTSNERTRVKNLKIFDPGLTIYRFHND